MKTLRNEELDILKGLAIILVVVGHAIQSRVVDFDHNLVFKGIYIFHMSLFFLLSGMVNSFRRDEVESSDFLLFLIRRAKQLLLPFFAWGFVAYLARDSHESLLGSIKTLVEFPDNGLWFLWVLFWFSAVSEFARLISAHSRIPRVPVFVLVFVSMLAAVVKFHLMGIGLMATHFPFFVAGIFHDRIIKGVKGKLEFIGIICSIAFLLSLFVWQRNQAVHFGFMIQETFGLPMSAVWRLVYLLIGEVANIAFPTFGIVTFLMSAKVLISNNGAVVGHTKKLLVFVGQRTLEIYALQFYFIGTGFLAGNILMDCIVGVIFAIVFSIFIAEILLKPSRVLSFALLGR